MILSVRNDMLDFKTWELSLKQDRHRSNSIIRAYSLSLLAEFSSVFVSPPRQFSVLLYGGQLATSRCRLLFHIPKTSNSDKPLARLPQPNGAPSPSLKQSMSRGMGYSDWTRPESHDILGADERVSFTQTMWAENRLRKNQGALTRRRNRCGQANPIALPGSAPSWLLGSLRGGCATVTEGVFTP